MAATTKSLIIRFFFSRSWKEKEAEAAHPNLRPPPTEDPIPDPLVPWNHRVCCRQGSPARQGCALRFSSTPSEEAAIEARPP